MTIVFDSNDFKIIIYIPNSVVCHVSWQKNQVSTILYEKVPKTLTKPQKRNLARNFKHMTIIYDSNHFNPIIYLKLCCVTSLVENKQSLNHFMRESAKNA